MSITFNILDLCNTPDLRVPFWTRYPKCDFFRIRYGNVMVMKTTYEAADHIQVVFADQTSLSKIKLKHPCEFEQLKDMDHTYRYVVKNKLIV